MNLQVTQMELGMETQVLLIQQSLKHLLCARWGARCWDPTGLSLCSMGKQTPK